MGVSRCPHMLRCSIHLDTPMHSDAPQCPHMFKWPLYVPNAPLCICMFWGYLHVIWGCRGSSCLDNPHVFGCFHMCLTPPHNYMLLCMSVCSRGHCMHYGGNIPYVGGWGLQHICQAFGVCQYIHWIPLCFILYLSCSSLYVSSLSLLPPLWLLLLQ